MIARFLAELAVSEFGYYLGSVAQMYSVMYAFRIGSY